MKAPRKEVIEEIRNYILDGGKIDLSKERDLYLVKFGTGGYGVLQHQPELLDKEDKCFKPTITESAIAISSLIEDGHTLKLQLI